jgi:hypothetical protein
MGGGGGVQETQDQVQEQTNNAGLWNYYQTSYKPFINKYIVQQSANAASGAEAKQAAGQVNAEIMKGVSKPSVSSGNPVNTGKKMDMAAGIESSALTDVDAKVKQQQMSSLQNIVDIGRGQATDANNLQSNIAEQSLQGAIKDKQAELQAQGQIEDSAGALIGAGLAGYKRMNKQPGTPEQNGDFLSSIKPAPTNDPLSGQGSGLSSDPNMNYFPNTDFNDFYGINAR